MNTESSANIHGPFLQKARSYCSNPRLMLALWLLIGIVSAVTKLQSNNNFLIFRASFLHTIEGRTIYGLFPDEYSDQNLYGPAFSLLIAPFAMVPVWLGHVMWTTALAACLFFAVKVFCSTVPTPSASTAARWTGSGVLAFIIWFCAHELLTALFMQQFNVAIAAIILLSYVFVEKEKDEWATLAIVVGTLVKLYGIVGLAFFFFSRHKKRFLLTLIGWSAVLFCLPMLISSPEYQLQQYREWMVCLSEKNGDNLFSIPQNISLLGLVRKTGYALSVGHTAFIDFMRGGASPDAGNWWYSGLQDLWLIAAGMLTMAVGYFRIGQWQHRAFRQTVLAAVLMFVCLFSTGTESSGYIIALVGCAIWFCAAPWRRSRWDVALMVFAFVLTSFSPSDLFPRTVREMWVQPYALKALPVALIWCKLAVEMIGRKYEGNKELKN